MKMKLATLTVTTQDIPHTIPILEKHLPSVLYSTCFNDEHLPFIVEVQSTEIGHLFEHILLEYLCYFKLTKGSKTAEYSGVTHWNWEKEPWGVFSITINTGYKESEVFSEALQQSILLMQLILQSTLSYPMMQHAHVTVPIIPHLESFKQ